MQWNDVASSLGKKLLKSQKQAKDVASMLRHNTLNYYFPLLFSEEKLNLTSYSATPQLNLYLNFVCLYDYYLQGWIFNFKLCLSVKF